MSLKWGGGSDFYPRPPRGGRREFQNPEVRAEYISIHALREEGDKPPAQRLQPLRDFYPRPPRGGRPLYAMHSTCAPMISIHALREEGDCSALRQFSRLASFLSTPSARRATCAPANCFPPPTHFYPRPPRGGRRSCRGLRQQMQDFYPRPPRGGRLAPFHPGGRLCQFLSTPSARRATRSSRWRICPGWNFYPRPPRGGRPQPQAAIAGHKQFLSTPSARRATRSNSTDFRTCQISIHALREEGDRPAIPGWQARI